MTAIRMALTELRRLTSSRIGALAVLAMVLIPTLYGGLYLYSNHDPYGRLDKVPAALVVQDAGATDAQGKPVDTGRQVADKLIKQHDFDWHEVSEQQARDGVRRGTYDFAVTIPKDFSAALTSSARFDPRQARLQMLTNDANSYLSTTIANTVVSKVRDAISSQVGEQAATDFLLGLNSIRDSLAQAATGADRLTSGAVDARSGANRLRSGATELRNGADTLHDGLGTLATKTSSLPAQTARLADGARQVADGNAKIARTGDEVADAATRLRRDYADRRADLRTLLQQSDLTAGQRQQILAVYDDLGTPVRQADSKVQQTARQLDRLSRGADQVAVGNRQLADATPALVDGIGRARTGAGTLATGAGKLATGARELDDGLGTLHTGAQKLAAGLHSGVKQVPDINAQTRDRIAKTLGDPVAVHSTSQASADTYGAGLAPFFCSLAAWIGGYVLFLLVRPLSQRALAANQTPIRVALAGWITPALLGALQVAVMLAVVLIGLRIVPANVAGTVLFLVATSATFIAIVHCLNVWLGAVGQFLGLVLMVLQLVTAGGTFPWQTIPAPLYPLHHVLPMSYSIDGLRQLMYGGLSARVWRDLLVLAIWFAVALVLTTIASRRQRVWTVKRVKPQLSL